MNCFPSCSHRSQYLPKKLWRHVTTRYSSRHPNLIPSFITSSFVQKDLFSDFRSWKGFPSPLPLLSIFLPKTSLVEALFRAIATTTQRPGAEIVRCVFSLGRSSYELWDAKKSASLGNGSVSPTDTIAFNTFIYIMNACGALQTCAAILVILKLATISDPRLVHSPLTWNGGQQFVARS